MKRFNVLLLLISVISILTACSSESSLELTDEKVEITNDKERLGSMILQYGENAGTEVVPTALYYTFSIKNVGSKKMGDHEENLNLTVEIEPNETLVSVSEEVMGINIFNPNEYNETGLGYGHTFHSTLEPNEEGEFTLHYDLGIDIESTEAHFVPSKNQLEKLEDNALEATVIVMLGDEEIARYDLSEE